jgi:hypothetical protein
MVKRNGDGKIQGEMKAKPFATLQLGVTRYFDEGHGIQILPNGTSAELCSNRPRFPENRREGWFRRGGEARFIVHFLSIKGKINQKEKLPMKKVLEYVTNVLDRQ